MTFETYAKNRTLFESRYLPRNEFKQCYINEMNKGIRNFEFFLALYGHDRRIILSSNTYGCDRRKRYIVPFKKDMIGTKIVIKDLKFSLFDKFPESFDRLKTQLTNHYNNL